MTAKFGDAELSFKRGKAEASRVTHGLITAVLDTVEDSPDLPVATKRRLMDETQRAAREVATGSLSNPRPAFVSKRKPSIEREDGENGQTRFLLLGYRPYDWTVTQWVDVDTSGRRFRAFFSSPTDLRFPEDFLEITQESLDDDERVGPGDVASWHTDSIYGDEHDVVATCDAAGLALPK
ncbi:hypothetical protein [Curtobacterium flaccumfaciens]|uniref:hypothetical protein n=1 Tax=Curtobacterium flaccumfaciens TaxID=2035 RepID=UPI00105DABE0|nr:hypothetical protein [Curtobacterium flaccumfaciens]